MRKLTKKQFDDAAKQTRKEARTIDMARSVLVEKKPAAEVARLYDASRQQVLNAVYLIYDIYLQDLGAPKGWIEVKGFFPAKEAKEISKRAKALLIEYNKTNNK